MVFHGFPALNEEHGARRMGKVEGIVLQKMITLMLIPNLASISVWKTLHFGSMRGNKQDHGMRLPERQKIEYESPFPALFWVNAMFFFQIKI